MDAVIIDSREPMHIQLINVTGVPVTVATLDAGDAWISAGGTLIVVERKTPGDLVNSIKDDRLFSQAARCRALTPWAYLVITGEIRADGNGMAIIGGRSSGWRFDAIHGALVTVQELGLYVVWCKDDTEYGPTLRRLAERERTRPVAVNPARSTYQMTPGESMLAALPGVGYERVKTLLQYKCTPALALAYLCDMDDYTIPGIGETTKRAACEAIGLAPGCKIHFDEIPF